MPDVELAESGALPVGLAPTGLSAGKEYAYEYSLPPHKFKNGVEGQYIGTGVVRDGDGGDIGHVPQAARSRNRPDGTPELTRRFIEMLYAG
jgi:hypothetical protein